MKKNTKSDYKPSPLKIIPLGGLEQIGMNMTAIEYGNDIGAALTIKGFESVFGSGLPAIAVAACLTLFALSTVLTWALYGSRCVEYLFGFKVSKVYQVIFCLFACIAGTVELDLAWAIADTLNGLMAIPNLIALFLLSGTVVKLVKEKFGDEAEPLYERLALYIKTLENYGFVKVIQA